MDLGTVLGMLFGVGLIIGAILLETGLDLFWSLPSIMIVLGGTLAAVSISYPTKDLKVIPQVTRQVFSRQNRDPEKFAATLIELAIKLKKFQIHEIPRHTKELKIDFLNKGAELIAGQVKPSIIETTLHTEMHNTQQRHRLARDIFMQMSKFAPAFGMVGTLIGLVQMLSSLADPTTIGPRMAVALLTTFYGAVIANLIFIPMANKVTRKNEEDALMMEMCQVLLFSVADGDQISLLKDKLSAYVYIPVEGEGKGKNGKSKNTKGKDAKGKDAPAAAKPAPPKK